MATIIIELHETSAKGMANEAHKHEIGLQLKDIGTDDKANFAIYDERFVVPKGELVFLPESSVPPQNADYVEQGPLIIGGVKQNIKVFRVPPGD